MRVAERRSDFKLTTDTPYLAPTGKLYGDFCKDIWENWPRYQGNALYFEVSLMGYYVTALY